MPKKDVSKTEIKEKKEKKHFFKDFKAELKRVIWPTPKQLANNTVAVITIVLITAIIVFALDFVFKMMDDYGIEKLRSIVATQNEQTNDTNTNQEEQNTNNEENNDENINNEVAGNDQTNSETANNEVTNNETQNSETSNNQTDNIQEENNTINE